MTSRRVKTSERDERITQLLAIGREHYEAREFAPAEPYLRLVAEALPDYADVQNMLGVTLYQQGKLELAREAFERALGTNPRYTEAALNLAVTYNELGSYAKGRFIHESVTPAAERDIDPFVLGKIANMHAEIARAYVDVRHYEAAIVQYREALRLCPSFTDLRTQLGDVLRDSGDVEAAVDEYHRACESNPQYVPARVHLGMALFILGRNDEALAEWEKALEMDPGNRLAQTSIRMVRSMHAKGSETSENEPCGLLNIDTDARPQVDPTPGNGRVEGDDP
jgi:tetratricopeptide (TPR) repeat protein